MTLILNENKNILTGTLTLSGNLGGGADIQGRKDGTSIAFVTRSAYGQISWSGTIKGDLISGHYMTESSPEYMAQTGLTESQRGIWSVTKK